MPTTPAQKRAIQAYREKNRDKVNAQARKDYEKLKTDPDRLAKYNEKRRARKQIYKASPPNIDEEFLNAFL